MSEREREREGGMLISVIETLLKLRPNLMAFFFSIKQKVIIQSLN
jgi:hypothetical protein